MVRHDDQHLHSQREELLEHVQALLEKPMTVLAFVWLALVVVGFTHGLSPRLSLASKVLWGLFVLDFLLEFWIAPHKSRYLRHNWLTALALLLPALGTLRVLRVVRLLLTAHTAGYLSLLRLITAINRGIRALRRTMAHRGIGFAISLSFLVLFAGAAGMLAFENPSALHQAGLTDAQTGGGLPNYGVALWFTAMLMTTIGTGYSPFTTTGRILCWMLSIFSVSIAGYLTASIASYFIGQDRTGTTEESA